MARYRYEIEPTPRSLGEGWLLRIWQREPDETEIEIGSGVFMHGTQNADIAYTEAIQFAESWLSTHEDATDERVCQHEPHADDKGNTGQACAER